MIGTIKNKVPNRIILTNILWWPCFINQSLNLLPNGNEQYMVATVNKKPINVPEIPAKLLIFELTKRKLLKTWKLKSQIHMMIKGNRIER